MTTTDSTAKTEMLSLPVRRTLAIDPGSSESAFVIYGDWPREAPASDRVIVAKGIFPNREMLDAIGGYASDLDPALECAIEMIASYGMAVGAEVFETCVWIGRFAERWEAMGDVGAARRVFRRDVKMHLCGNNKAKDGNIRQALIDKFGGTKEAAIGKKATPGPLYGVRADEWAALALAVTCREGGARS